MREYVCKEVDLMYGTVKVESDDGGRIKVYRDGVEVCLRGEPEQLRELAKLVEWAAEQMEKKQ